MPGTFPTSEGDRHIISTKIWLLMYPVDPVPGSSVALHDLVGTGPRLSQAQGLQAHFAASMR